MSEDDEKHDRLPLLREKPLRLNYTKRYDQVSWHSADTDFEPDPSASSADERRHKIKKPTFTKRRKQKIAALVIVVVIFLSVMCGLIYVYVERGGDYIEIPCGKILGVSEDDIYIYKGIPYAKSPTNHLRWKAPVSYGQEHCWKDVFKAETYKKPCAGGGHKIVFGSEDCLYLNVYTTMAPNTEPALLPVIVYFPSELSSQNSKNGGVSLMPNPSFVKNMNAVVVLVNNRIDSFGFLSLSKQLGNKSTLYGNFGLYDQIEALGWVRENIRYFGGDYNAVTIMGKTSVYALLASPLAQGKFDKAFVFGGSTNFNVSFQTAANLNEGMLSRSKCGNLTDLKLEKCLYGLSTDEVLDIFYVNSSSRWDFPTVSTKVEDYLVVEEPNLLPYPPQSIPQHTSPTKVSVLVGSTAQEVGYKSSVDLKSWKELETFILARLNSFSSNFSDIVLHKLYASRRHDSTPNMMYQTITSDMRIICPTNELIAKMKESPNHMLYRYIFEFSDKPAHHNSDIVALLSMSDEAGRKVRENLKHFLNNGQMSEFGWDSSKTAVINEKGDISLLPGEYHKEQCLFWNKPENGFQNFAWRN